MSLKSELAKIAVDIDKILSDMMPEAIWENAPVNVARYASLDAGKRLRSFLTVQSAGLFNVPYMSALRAGACIEMIHNFSLIHDDLPCIDNDVLRRGRASAWAKYGERNSVLSGDYLLNRAYGILGTDTLISEDSNIRLGLVGVLSEMTEGMILGEWMDCEAEKGNFQTNAEIMKIQSLKTGCIFKACVKFGAVMGRADTAQTKALVKFADAMGLCFQITDDILDAIGDQIKVGKTLRKDSSANKATFVSLLGLDGARQHAMELAASATDALSIFDNRADNMRELMDYMISRES